MIYRNMAASDICTQRHAMYSACGRGCTDQGGCRGHRRQHRSLLATGPLTRAQAIAERADALGSVARRPKGAAQASIAAGVKVQQVDQAASQRGGFRMGAEICWQPERELAGWMLGNATWQQPCSAHTGSMWQDLALRSKAGMNQAEPTCPSSGARDLTNDSS